jgi:hypothetical protein
MRFRAKLMRYCDLSWSALTEIKSWLKRSRGLRDGFTVVSFNNPKLQVISATNEDGQTMVHCLIEPCYMFSAYLSHPDLKDKPEETDAGNAIDAALYHQAQMDGVTRLLMVLPDSHRSEPNERWVRIVEKKVPQIATTQGVGCIAPSPAVFVN